MSKSRFDALRGNSARAWQMRAGVALIAGLVVGVGGGFLGLRVLTGGATPVPMPEVELEPEPPAPRRTYSGPRADGMRASDGNRAMVGGGTSASRDSIAVVPDLIGRAEGDARRLLERAGFTLGEIMFRQADERLGTVLETFPVPGERVQLPATVNLILADRRRYIEQPDRPSDTTGGIPDSLRSPPDSVHTVPDSMRAVPDTVQTVSYTVQTAPNSLRTTHSLSATPQ